MESALSTSPWNSFFAGEWNSVGQYTGRLSQDNDEELSRTPNENYQIENFSPKIFLINEMVQNFGNSTKNLTWEFSLGVPELLFSRYLGRFFVVVGGNFSCNVEYKLALQSVTFGIVGRRMFVREFRNRVSIVNLMCGMILLHMILTHQKHIQHILHLPSYLNFSAQLSWRGFCLLVPLTRWAFSARATRHRRFLFVGKRNTMWYRI